MGPSWLPIIKGQKEMARGLGSLPRGLNPNANEVLSPLSLLAVPHVTPEGMDGSGFLNLPGLSWHYDFGMAEIGTSPLGSRLSCNGSPLIVGSSKWFLSVIHSLSRSSLHPCLPRLMRHHCHG